VNAKLDITADAPNPTCVCRRAAFVAMDIKKLRRNDT
jgi:hypothetical protein